MAEPKCDHIVGVYNKKLIHQSELLYPENKFNYCPKCGSPINWDYLFKQIIFK